MVLILDKQTLRHGAVFSLIWGTAGVHTTESTQEAEGEEGKSVGTGGHPESSLLPTHSWGRGQAGWELHTNPSREEFRGRLCDSFRSGQWPRPLATPGRWGANCSFSSRTWGRISKPDFSGACCSAGFFATAPWCPVQMVDTRELSARCEGI